MLNIIWCGMMLASIVIAIVTGRIPELTAAMNEGAQEAVTLALSMLGMMCAWNGLMYVADRAGATPKIARLFRPAIRWLFPEYREDTQVQNRMSLNFAANLLGLGNAATPLGLATMKEMSKHSQGEPTPGMMLFIVINAASLQVIPTYAVTLRGNYGCADPYDILPCVWLASLSALAVSVTAAKCFEARARHG